MLISAVLILSVLFQLVAAAYALYMIKITGLKYSWIFISAALVLMTLRRIISLISIRLGPGAMIALSLPVEVTGLVLSVSMLAGVLGIRSIFMENRVKELKIEMLLAEKEVILKEVHHRIKNNMNTIKSLLSLQAESMKNSMASESLKDAENRVYSMMMLYDRLYQSSDILEMDVSNYLPLLVETIYRNFSSSSKVKLEMQIDSFVLDTKRLQTLGIIINELITNAMKYAYVEKEKGLLLVEVLSENDRVSVRIADNGSGFPDFVNPDDPENFGMSLVKMLTAQLKGNLQIDFADGTVILLSFPK